MHRHPRLVVLLRNHEDIAQLARRSDPALCNVLVFRDDRPHVAFDHRQQQIDLGGEEVIERPLVDVGLGADFGNTDVMKAAT